MLIYMIYQRSNTLKWSPKSHPIFDGVEIAAFGKDNLWFL